MKVSVIGAGYVGLVSAVCLAEKGHQVSCVDSDTRKVDMLRDGLSPIYEQGLEELLQRNIGKGLTASTSIEQAILATELSIIAVGTPFDGSAIDVSHIKSVSKAIGNALLKKSEFHTVVVKSTVVPGTTDDIVVPIIAEASGKSLNRGFGVAMNPEFLREGTAVSDFMTPDRIVYGTSGELSFKMLDELYAVFPDVDKVRTTARTAEMIKYTANSLLATLISFSNEIGNLCAALGGVDVTEVMAGVHLDQRISPILEDGRRITPDVTTYLEAGCGFGGSCFPKDVQALIAHGELAGCHMPLLRSVMDTNQSQPMRLMELLRKYLPDMKGKRIAVLGLAFKPGTDDMRESPSIPLVKTLHDAGANVVVFDPVAIKKAQNIFSDVDISYAATLGDAVKDSDALVLVTSWPEFQRVPEFVNNSSDDVIVIDGRRMLDKHSVPRYDGIGL